MLVPTDRAQTANAVPATSSDTVGDWAHSGLLSHPAQWLKRAIDLPIAILLCVLLFPLFAFIAIAITLDSRGPVFFRQRRYGLGFQPFTIIKFRSMQYETPDPHETETNSSYPRITRVGAWIRRTGLDELPQLFNVIGGSMSLVGPRPLIESESREHLACHRERFRTKPGITGLQQINVRNPLDAETRADWDIEYVRRWNPLLDFEIMLKTPRSLLHGDDISYEPDDILGR